MYRAIFYSNRQSFRSIVLISIFKEMSTQMITTQFMDKRQTAKRGFRKPSLFLTLKNFPSTDEQIDLEKQRLYPGTDIQVYSPGGGHISKNSSRRGSGNNNSDKNSLSGHISNYSQSRRGSNRSSCGGDSEHDPRASLQRNGAIVTSGK